ncbi:MAG: Flp family type IVb pilin [Planctomycetes bacterium]|nr:Flp family type IVb pilin [Planctomycetota bacterium]
MRDFLNRLAELYRSEDGPTAVEYAVMLALIIAVCAVSIAAVGTNTNTKFANPVLSQALGGS